jgi:hypothetical protein
MHTAIIQVHLLNSGRWDRRQRQNLSSVGIVRRESPFSTFRQESLLLMVLSLLAMPDGACPLSPKPLPSSLISPDGQTDLGRG